MAEPSYKTLSPVEKPWSTISKRLVSTSAAANVIGFIINLSNSELYLTEIGVVVPMPTDKLGTTFIFTTSPFSKLCVVVSAAPILVVTVLIILSTSPVTWVCWEVKLYKSDPIPELIPFPKKYNPSLVFATPAFVVTIPI